MKFQSKYDTAKKVLSSYIAVSLWNPWAFPLLKHKEYLEEIYKLLKYRSMFT